MRGRTAIAFAIVCLLAFPTVILSVPAPSAASDSSRATAIIDITYYHPTSATLGHSDYDLSITLHNNAYTSDNIQVINGTAKLLEVIDPDGVSVGITGGPFTFKKTESDSDEKINLTSFDRTFTPIRFDMLTSGKQGKFELKIKFTYKSQKGTDPQVSAEETDSVKVDVRSGITAIKRVECLEDSGRIYTGTDFQHVGVMVSNNVGNEISEVTVTMDLKAKVPWLPNKDTYPFVTLQESEPTPKSTASSYIKSMGSGGFETFNFRIAVESDTTPGLYPAIISVQFTTEIDDKDVTILAKGILVEFAVEFTPLLAINDPAPQFTIRQGASTIDLTSVDLTNIGNADLLRLEFWIDIYNYFEQNNFYYEGKGGDKVPEPEKKVVTSIEKGTSTSISFTDLKLFKYLPPGEHRIKVRYNGYYYNDGTTGETSGFLETNEGIYLAIKGVPLYIDVVVTDDNFDLSAESSNSLTLGGTEKDLNLAVTVTNNEAVDILYANFSLSCTPQGLTNAILVNPRVPASKSLDQVQMMTFQGRSTATVRYNADLVTGVVAGFYSFPLTVTGYNGDTGEPLSTAITVPVSVRVNPPPPKLEIVDVKTSDIKPGETFTLTLKVENKGGATATGVNIRIADDDKESDYSATGEFLPDVAFAESAIHPFSTLVSIKYIDDIPAGSSADVVFMMNASDKAVTGKYYEEAVVLSCGDGYGRTFTSAPEISMKVPGDSPKKPVPPPDYTPLLYPLMIGIILVVLAFGLAMIGIRQLRKPQKGQRIATEMETSERAATAPVPAPAPEPRYEGTKPSQASTYEEQPRTHQHHGRGHGDNYQQGARAPPPRQQSQPQQPASYPYQDQQPQYAAQPDTASAGGYTYSAEVGPTDAAPPRACPRCGRSVAAGMRLCPYCGCAV